MTSTLCGLLCRLIGTRFVASTADTVISQVGVHGSCSNVRIKINVRDNKQIIEIQVLADSNRNVVKTASRRCPSHTTEIAHTACLARWAFDHIVSCAFIQTPYPGIVSVTYARASVLCKAAGAFAKTSIISYKCDTHEGISNAITILFGETNIVVKNTKGESDTISLNGVTCRQDTHDVYYHAPCLDQMISDLCRTTFILFSQQRKG